MLDRWLALLQVRLFESVNFLDFARLLAAFSDRCSYEEKVRFIFKVYDVDGDGECCCSQASGGGLKKNMTCPLLLA